MTKKHFIALADAIKQSDTKFTLNHLYVIARFCKDQNYNFDQDRWLNYIAGECGPGGGAIKKGKS